MSMQDWHKNLEALDLFINKHPEIEVSSTGLAIPRTCREEFYETAEQVSSAIASAVMGDTAFAQKTVAALDSVKGTLEQRLGMDVVLPSELRAFCNNPLKGSAQTFLSHVLSYVQGNLGADSLYEQAKTQVGNSFKLLNKAAYETWLGFCAINCLEPYAAWRTATPDQKQVVAVKTDSLEVGAQKYSATLRLPGAVFETKHGIWAVKFELANEVDHYGTRPLRRRDYSAGGDTRGTVGRRYLMMYRLQSLDHIPFLADRDKQLVFTPTALMCTMWPDDIRDSLYCRGTIQRAITLAPKKGTFVAALEGCSADVLAANEPYNAPLTVADASLDPAMLNDFIDSLDK